MTAMLDRGRNYGDLAGGVSDPRLVEKLGTIPQNTPEEIAVVKTMITRSFPGPSAAAATARKELHEIVFGSEGPA